MAKGIASGIASIRETVAEQTVADNGTIASDINTLFQHRRVKGNGGVTSASDTPFGDPPTKWRDGTVILLTGTNNAQPLVIVNNDATSGAILNGNISLGEYQTLTLQYDATAGTDGRWIEIGRN